MLERAAYECQIGIITSKGGHRLPVPPTGHLPGWLEQLDLHAARKQFQVFAKGPMPSQGLDNGGTVVGEPQPLSSAACST
jgi:hypothetical protein